jgi:hypothetical protein
MTNAEPSELHLDHMSHVDSNEEHKDHISSGSLLVNVIDDHMG